MLLAAIQFISKDSEGYERITILSYPSNAGNTGYLIHFLYLTMELNEFLTEAKKNTYAKEGEKGEKKLEDGTREFTYEKGEFRYYDRYFGLNPFIGQEVVWENNKVIRVMNYWGLVYSDIVSPAEIYAFLRKALSRSDSMVPLRGPDEFEEGDFSYRLVGGGMIEKYFQKVEMILYKGERVYEGHCHGGLIKN